jgi:hypothetical protein
MDLLTPQEESIDELSARFRFDIELLAARLVCATDWLSQQPDTQHLAVEYFGASTGAAAALIASARRVDVVQAVVSRGGRPDLLKPCPKCGPPHYSLWVVATRWYLSSSRPPSPACAARRSSRSCPALRIFSKSLAPSTRSRASRATGLSAFSYRGCQTHVHSRYEDRGVHSSY